jgi:hypothetical protein
MTKETVANAILGPAIGAVLAVVAMAGKGWLGDETKDIRQKVAEHALLIVRTEAMQVEVIRRLDRIEKKLDDITTGSSRK